jgi:hypothetical protein
MLLEPRDLLECVAAMTPKQRACLCELLDPAVSNALENVVEAEIDTAMKRAICGPDGPQGPPFEDRDNSMTISGCQRVPAPGFVFRPPSPDVVAKLLYRQMTGKNLVMPATDENAVLVNVKRMLAEFPAEAIEPADDTVVMGPPGEAIHHARWANARARWQQLFGEDLPIPRSARSEAELGLLEGMVYDKGVKNLEPSRCICGCGYVIGCGKTTDLHHMED